MQVDYQAIDYQGAPRPYVISKINMEGVSEMSRNILLSMSRISVGDTIILPSNTLPESIRSMWAGARYFSSVSALVETSGDQVEVTFVFKELPRISEVAVTGVNSSQSKDIIEKLALTKGKEYSEFVMQNSIRIIKEFLATKAYLDATVETKTTPDPVRENYINLEFAVTRNKKVKVGRIDFSGNQTLSDKKLRRSFKKTHQPSINVFQSKKFNTKEYEADKGLMIDYYNTKGFRDAMVVSDSVYRYKSRKIGIDITVEEGDKYYFGDIRWIGNTLYSGEELSHVLGIKKGDTYDRERLDGRLFGASADDECINSMYQNLGYLGFSLETIELVEGDTINIDVVMIEGSEYTINSIKVTGNERVNDNVIIREMMLQPGQLYNRDLIMSTIQRLTQLQLFDPETIASGLSIDPAGNNSVDLGFNLAESPSDKFEISGGWGGYSFVGSIGVRFANLSMRNLFKKGEWKPYPGGDGQSLQIRAQTNGQYYKAFSVAFNEPWLGGKKANSFTVSAHYSDETDATYVFQTASRHFRTFGVSVGLGQRLKWPDPFFTLYTGLTYSLYKLDNWYNTFIITDGVSNTISLDLTLNRNTTNHPIFPTRGSNLTVALSLTPPYSLFDDTDYTASTITNQDRYRWIEYNKWGLKMEWYNSLSRPDKQKQFVLFLRAEMGYLGHYSLGRISPFERYDVGGDGMVGYNIYGYETIGLRGYENSSLTPDRAIGEYARVYNKFTTELRYPLVTSNTAYIFGLVFAEAGNGYRDWQSFDPFAVKRSVGVGFRLFMPMFGLLGFDWGYGFDHVRGEKAGTQMHFSMGGNF